MDDLLTMTHSSPGLRNAVTAVAALHAKSQGLLVSARPEGRFAGSDSLNSYVRSVQYVQGRISAGTFMEDESALWTTFLLGLFEVCISTHCSIRSAICT